MKYACDELRSRSRPIIKLTKHGRVSKHAYESGSDPKALIVTEVKRLALHRPYE